MKKFVFSLLSITILQACITMPVTEKTSAKDGQVSKRCELSADKKTLKIIDVAKETNSFYSISGLVLSPILIPSTAIISGSYVLINNTYRLGEEIITCDN